MNTTDNQAAIWEKIRMALAPEIKTAFESYKDVDINTAAGEAYGLHRFSRQRHIDEIVNGPAPQDLDTLLAQIAKLKEFESVQPTAFQLLDRHLGFLAQRTWSLIRPVIAKAIELAAGELATATEEEVALFKNAGLPCQTTPLTVGPRAVITSLNEMAQILSTSHNCGHVGLGLAIKNRFHPIFLEEMAKYEAELARIQGEAA